MDSSFRFNHALCKLFLIHLLYKFTFKGWDLSKITNPFSWIILSHFALCEVNSKSFEGKMFSSNQITKLKKMIRINILLIDLIGVLVNAMHSGWSGYSWDFNRMDIPITQFSLKIHSNLWGNPIDQNALHLPKLR